MLKSFVNYFKRYFCDHKFKLTSKIQIYKNITLDKFEFKEVTSQICKKCGLEKDMEISSYQVRSKIHENENGFCDK